MRNIRNLKDPTIAAAAAAAGAAASRLPLSLAFALALAVTLHGSSGTTAAQGGSWTRTALPAVVNVSCIAHDAQYTCDCQHEQQDMLLPPLAGNVYQVEVRNCRTLTVNANALANTQNLQRIKFKQVDNLVLNKHALAIPRHASNTALIIAFEQVNFELIDSHAIDGNINEIAFIGGSIDVIQPFGFTTIKERATLLKLEGVRIRRIEQQAFKKFVVEQIEISNCHFEGNVPSRTFYELEVLETFSMQNNRFQKVHSHAFSFKLISKLSIAGNIFTDVEGEWFEAYVRESIVIRENYLGRTSDIAFRGIKLHRDYQLSERMELRFLNNTLQAELSREPQSLDFDARFALELKQLRYDNTWPCHALDTAQQPAVPKSAFFRLHSDNIFFRRDDSAAPPHLSQSFVALSRIIEWDCQRRSYVAYIIGGSLLLALIILLTVLLVWCCIAKKRKRRKMDVVQPEPRTYKETQIIYQIENAGLLKTDL